MASEEVLDEEASGSSEGKESKKEKKKKEKKEKKAKKDKKGNNQDDGEEEEKESIGGKLVLVLVTLLILLIWLAIFAVLIKADIGGFGSTVMYPIFKDVPYINQILPNVSEGEGDEEKYNFDSIEEAVDYIKELEKQLKYSRAQVEADASDIEALNKQIEELSKYKAEQEAFEKLKDDFYDDVLYYTSDEYDLYDQGTLTVLEAYRKYFEEIDSARAEALYKEVITQISNAEEYDDYVNKYANMKAKNAAAIMDELVGMEQSQLVADILNHMKVQNASDILAAMQTENAAIVTVLLKPELR